MKFKRATAAIALLWFAIAHHFAGAAVTPEEAAKLKSELTPLGAEKAGNKDGTIPAWEGGYTTVWPGYRSGQPRPDPFAAEKPRLQITAKNMQQYAGQLSEGVKALLQRYSLLPARCLSYPSHRSCAAVGLRQYFQERHPCQARPRCSRWLTSGRCLWGHPVPDSRDGAASDVESFTFLAW